jgi:GntR family transcriptional regulator/MocR family aminotransferase
VFLTLDNEGPLYAQLCRALRAEILCGRIAPGARVPASRWLAGELRLSRNIVIIAYEQLVAEGYLTARQGAGTFVAAELPEDSLGFAPAASATATSERPRAAAVRLSAYARRLNAEAARARFNWEPRRALLPYDFRYGRPSLADFPHAAWCRVLARRARRATVRDLDYGPAEGLPALRVAVADYLHRARAVNCAPEQVLILSGSQQALDLAARVVIEPGDRVVLEDPHYRAARAVFEAAGARVTTVPVDEHGIRIGRLRASRRDYRLVFVTPSHQFPTGALMPLARRLELLSWAARAKALVFEDDYDGEYRYSGRPIEALAALDRGGCVLYAGTFSKLMFPALRLGYLVLPPPLVEPFRSAKALLDTGSPALPQLALVDFIRDGHFERHLRRSRMRNGVRRAALLDAVAECFGARARVAGANAGLHVLLWLPGTPFARTPELIQRAARTGVGVYSVGPFYSAPPRCAGLLMGYAALTEREIREGVRRLAAALA